jgi:hypothetical protein
MLSEIAFEQIKDNYWYGSYGEFRVVVDKSTGYINASKMCCDGGKDFYNWSRLKGSHELVEALVLENSLADVSADLDYMQTHTKPQIWGLVCKSITTAKLSTEDKLIAGTYCHPDLIPSIAGWISPEFQIKANRVVNEYILREYKRELQDVKVQLEITAANEQHRKDQITALRGIVVETRSNDLFHYNSLASDEWGEKSLVSYHIFITESDFI